MKKVIRIAVIFLCIVFIGLVGFKTWSAKLVKEARELEDVFIDLSKVEDGTYEGHSELGPVIVDVKVTVKKGRITEIEIVYHQNGLGQSANVIVGIPNGQGC